MIRASIITFWALFAGEALAQCASYPNPLTDMTTAYGSQVTANFNCAALTGNGLFINNVHVYPAVTPTSPAGATQLMIGEATHNPTYQLNIGYYNYGSGYAGVVQTIANGVGYPLMLNPTGGNVGVGGVLPAATLDIAGYLHAAGSTAPVVATQGAYLGWNAISGGGTGETDFINNKGLGAGGFAFLNSTALSAPLMFIAGAAGNVDVNSTQTTYQFYVNGSAAGTLAWINASDGRLKTGVTKIADPLGLVSRLRGVRFQWKPADQREVGKSLSLPVGEPQIGFIAQEVAAVVPEAVVAPKAGSTDTYSMREGNLIPILVEAVKEQQVEIEQLRTELAALKKPR